MTHTGPMVVKVDPDTDPRYQTGALVTDRDKILYEVRRWERTGTNSGKLWVIDCSKPCEEERVTWISHALAAKTTLVRRAPARATS